MPNAGKKRGRRRRGKRVVRNEHEDPVSRIESQLALLPMAERSPELTAKAVKVIRGWHERLDPPSWRRVRKRVAKELNECGPALEWLQAEIPRLSRCHGGARVTIVDLCSGFGIFSMFASELLPPECLDRILLVDRSFPCKVVVPPSDAPAKPRRKSPPHISTDHLTARGWPTPLHFRKVNIKATRQLRQLTKYVFQRCEGPVIIVGLHLCRALSVKAIDIFNTNPSFVSALLLKPCCLPGRALLQIRKPPLVWTSTNGFRFSPADVYGDQAATVLGRHDNEQVDMKDDPVKSGSSESGAEVESHGEPTQQKSAGPLATVNEANTGSHAVGKGGTKAVGDHRSSHTRSNRVNSDVDTDSVDGMEVHGNEHDAEFRPEVRHRIFDRWVEHLLQYVDVGTSSEIEVESSAAGQRADASDARQAFVGQGDQVIAQGPKLGGFKAKRFWSVQNSHFQNQFLVACRGMLPSMASEHSASAVQASAAV